MSPDLRYVVRHTSLFTYSVPVSESIVEVRMQPRSDGGQRCLRFELTTQPRAKVLWYEDALGNVVHHFNIPGRHGRLSIKADAVVQVAPPPPVPESLPDAVWQELDGAFAHGERWEDLHWSHFSRETSLLAELADELEWRRDGDPLTMMRRLTSDLFKAFTYAPRTTRVDSPIDEALQTRAGVCQDLAHIMIALARRVGIPCRYVSGYLSPKGDHQDRSVEGATHAWAEAFLPGLDWVGFDPTNDAVAGERHIRVALGRDYLDVPPTRGVFRGEAASELGVLVTVTPLDARTAPKDVPPSMWVTSEVEKTSNASDYIQQQQQQQQQ